jgi:hypothetical protein
MPDPEIVAPTDPISITILTGVPKLNEDKFKVVPAFTVAVPVIFTALKSVTPDVLSIVRLLNVDVAGILCAPEPLNVTVPPHVLPPVNGVADVFCVSNIPE